MPEFEYFEGTKVIEHEDGSRTYIQTTHEPYVEPLTKKETAVVIGIATSMFAGFLALPFIVERVEDWSNHRREIRKIRREKKLEQVKAETEQ